MKNRQIKTLSLDCLRPHSKNVRVHSKKQIKVLARSIKRFGFNSPVLINRSRVILAGHARFEAAKHLGLREIPTIEIAGLSEAEERAFVLADNKIAEKAGWDRAALACELNDLAPLLEPVGLDLQSIGFEPAEIDALMGDLVDPEQDPADELPEVGLTPDARRPRSVAAEAGIEPVSVQSNRVSTKTIQRLEFGDQRLALEIRPPWLKT